MIIGITGFMGSGKGEVVRILGNLGFRTVTLSSFVREEASRYGANSDREALIETGNRMRKEGGAGILTKLALKRIEADKYDKWLIDGIRNPAEINELRKGQEVFIVGVHANEDLIVKRILARDRSGDVKTSTDIKRKLKIETGEGQPLDGQQISKCMELADIIIENNGSLQELEGKFMAYYNSLRAAAKRVYGRPSKDEYYLDLARSVCRRATCTKVEIGAVIIREDQVVATGYCGAPRGTKSSLEHGFCLRKKLGIPSGHRYEMCRSVHAEQNAIINAARSGTGLLGGDMYIYGKIRGEDGAPDQALDAFPCFICKKMLINCGMKRIICSLKDGGFKIFHVEEWTSDWQKNDIIDDKFQYGVEYK